jgi:hypothetical protein
VNRTGDCDAPDAPTYIVGVGRCGRHTGNNTQGHYWSWCKLTKALREFHHCCPGDCELGDGELGDGVDVAP